MNADDRTPTRHHASPRVINRQRLPVTTKMLEQLCMTDPFNPDTQATGESPVIGRSLLLNAERAGKPLVAKAVRYCWIFAGEFWQPQVHWARHPSLAVARLPGRSSAKPSEGLLAA